MEGLAKGVSYWRIGPAVHTPRVSGIGIHGSTLLFLLAQMPEETGNLLQPEVCKLLQVLNPDSTRLSSRLSLYSLFKSDPTRLGLGHAKTDQTQAATCPASWHSRCKPGTACSTPLFHAHTMKYSVYRFLPPNEIPGDQSNGDAFAVRWQTLRMAPPRTADRPPHSESSLALHFLQAAVVHTCLHSHNDKVKFSKQQGPPTP